MYVWGMTNPITGNWWVPRPPSPHARLLRSAIPVWSKHVFGASHAWLVRSPCLPTDLHGYGCVLQSKHPIQKGISQGWKCVDLISVPSNGIGETSFMHERFNLKSMSSSIIQVNIPLITKHIYSLTHHGQCDCVHPFFAGLLQLIHRT